MKHGAGPIRAGYPFHPGRLYRYGPPGLRCRCGAAATEWDARSGEARCRDCAEAVCQRRWDALSPEDRLEQMDFFPLDEYK